VNRAKRALPEDGTMRHQQREIFKMVPNKSGELEKRVQRSQQWVDVAHDGLGLVAKTPKGVVAPMDFNDFEEIIKCLHSNDKA
jgi:hypothetical protein